MKRIILPVICLILCSGGLLGALDFEITGGINLLTFDPDMTAAYNDEAAADSEFKPHLFILGNITLKDEISDILGYSINLNRDSILRNSIGGTLIAKTDYIKFEFGPFFGMADALEVPFAGITGGLEFMVPGVFFAGVTASSTIGSQLDFISDNTRETASAKAGFWLPFMITTFSANTSNFSNYIDAGLTTNDNLIRYQVSFDFFSKKNPTTLRVDAGYKTLRRSYIYSAYSAPDPEEDADDPDTLPPSPSVIPGSSPVNTTDTLNAFYAGFELRIQTRSRFRIIIGAELPIFFNSIEPITVPLFFYMPKAYVGFGVKSN